uniref:PGG domain-containing protein n=1 Tax=Medicago truncatula TaxID=3880 RepID=I3S502_MEDTR|nr:unknown [Medicago truncatula]
MSIIPQQNPSKDNKWLDDMKGSISLTASLIATLTFSLATNPPGGVVQASLDDSNYCSTILNTRMVNTTICLGEAILATRLKDDYLAFLICNTFCFIASLSVIFVLVSGIPINNKFLIWLLSIVMSIILSGLALTYLFAAGMVTPNSLWDTPGSGFGKALISWVLVVLIVYIIVLVCACVECAKKCCS